MFYCRNCHALREQDRCPRCGQRRLMAPQTGDFCFLEETEALWAGMLEDVLLQAGIPCLQEPALGAGLTASVGRAQERMRFYVPFGRMAEARDLADGLFHRPVEEETQKN